MSAAEPKTVRKHHTDNIAAFGSPLGNEDRHRGIWRYRRTERRDRMKGRHGLEAAPIGIYARRTRVNRSASGPAGRRRLLFSRSVRLNFKCSARRQRVYSVGRPASFQAVKPPSRCATRWYPMSCNVAAARAERPPLAQWTMTRRDGSKGSW